MEHKKLESFKDLTVWQKAVNAAVVVYKMTESSPPEEIYGLSSQMRRAAISISSNIAEGFKRNHHKEKAQFYNIAHASVAELESQILVAQRLSFVKDIESQQILSLLEELSKMLNALRRPKISRVSALMMLILFLYPLSSILYTPVVSAASVTFDPAEVSVAPESSILISLDVTSNEAVNAFEGTIPVPGHLEITEIIDGGSIITVWIERPRIEKGILRFSGVTPGGFVGKGTILLLRVNAKTKGEGAFIFRGRVLRHDGNGTTEPLSIGLSLVKVGEQYGKRMDTLEDDEPPEEFVLSVTQDPNIFDGAWFVAWETQDKGSGIKGYEVIESSKATTQDGVLIPKDTNWVSAQSPYQLKDQKRTSYIFVRAIDNKGNIRMSVIEPGKVKISLFVLFGGLIFLVVVWLFLYYYKGYFRRTLE